MRVREELTSAVRYHFRRDPVEGPVVNAIKNGPDYLVLANDLRYLHEMFLRFPATLARDRFYDAKMIADAKRLSDEILDALDRTAVDSIRWVDRVATLWSMVKTDYNELKSVGRFLLRATPSEAERRFPALAHSPGRPRRSATKGSTTKTPANNNSTHNASVPV
jgi:hypothetical protein